jgi:hypothetical protein
MEGIEGTEGTAQAQAQAARFERNGFVRQDRIGQEKYMTHNTICTPPTYPTIHLSLSNWSKRMAALDRFASAN